MTRSSKLLMYGMGAVFAFILLQKAFIMYTDFLWYQSLGQAAVFSTTLWTRALLGVIVGGLFFVWLYANLRLARRPVPGDLVLIGKRLLPNEERQQIEQYADKALLVFALTGALMAGIVASGKWREYLQFTHALPFNLTDPLFKRDIGFYVFRLPFISYVWQSIFYSLVVAIVASTLVHVYQEAVRLVGNTVHAIPRARVHILGLLGVALLVKAYSYRLAEFNLLYSTRGEQFFGASYADVHARLPVLLISIIVAAAAGVVVLVSMRQKNLTIPAGALIAVFLVSLIGGWIYPVALQGLVVKPNQLNLESPFIAHNIKATLQAYGLDTIKPQRHQVRDNLDAAALARNKATVDNIRLWDHRPLETTFQQTQALRGYYRFADVDVDRYTVEGEYRQVMLSARQLDYSGITGANWFSQHLLYTHGYGLCLSPVNEIVGDGLPRYWVKDLPVEAPKGLEVTRPQLYYYTSWHPRLIEYISPPEQAHQTPAPQPQAPGGPGGGPGAGPEPPGSGPNPMNEPAAPTGSGANRRQQPAPVDVPYVIVNTTAHELDYPSADDTSGKAAADESNVYTRYQGKGDVRLSNAFVRFAFFMRFRHAQILLTQSITPESRILFNRALPERLMALAPIMGYDPDPYLVIANGELKWINDAYTATNMYPYAARTPWFGGNYVRNSVKVVTDAYEGLPEFYVMPPMPGQQPDPIIACWRSVFPSLFKDFTQMDPTVQKHIRYPQLLFRIQAEMYAKYHMQNPQTFFQKEDLWAIPPEVYSGGRREVESYYVNMKLPTAQGDQEEFLLMLPFTLARREDKNMVAWMAGRCDGANYGELIVYDFPKSTLVQGPMQVESRISQDAEISQLITLWGQQQSSVIRGNLLVIPVEDSLLYVEPIYLEAPNSPLPQLKLVVLAYEDKIVNAPTLELALARLFGASGATPSGTSAPPRISPVKTPAARGQMSGLKQVLMQAVELDRQAQQALARGDLAGYQAKQQQQSKLLEQALQSSQ